MSSSTVNPTRTLRADALRNREKVLDAARAAFAAEGMEAQMDTIARHAGVGVGTVYRHFPTKEALLDALWTDKRERVVALSRQALKNPDPWGAVVEMFTRGTDMVAKDLAWCQAVGTTPRGWTTADAPPELLAAVDSVLERARQAGALRPDFGFDDVGHVFCSISAVIASHGPEARHGMLRIILDGLRAPVAI